MSDLCKTVLRTLEILELLVKAGIPLSLDEITHLTGDNKTAVFRSLKTLAHKNYVSQERDKYFVTLKLATMAGEKIKRIDIIDIISPFIKELVNEINLSVHCSVREGEEVVFIYNVDSPENDLKLSFDLGKRSPIYCTAAGKVFLAYLPKQERDILLNRINFKKYTKNTITDKNNLLEELDLIYNRGYAVDNEEHNQGIMCIGAPIKDYNGDVKNVISIIGLKHDIKMKGVNKLGKILKNKSQQISEKLA